MLCAPLDWQYAEFPSSASDAVFCTVLVCKMWDILPNKKNLKKNNKKTQKNPTTVKAIGNHNNYFSGHW